jgi:hypothetical protein
MVLPDRKHPWRALAIAAAAALSASIRLAAGQESTPQQRLSGVWQLDPSVSSTLWSDNGSGAARGKSNIDDEGGRGKSADPLPSYARAAISLMADLADAPQRMTITAHPDAVTVIDDHGTVHKFTANNLIERLDYGTTKVAVRTHWDDSRLTQDFSADNIDLSRAFQTTPDGQHLTITLVVRRQPDPRVDTSSGGMTKTYIYKRP